MNSTHQFFATLAITFVGLAAGGAFLQRGLSSARHHQFQSALESRQAAQVVAIGNSVVAAGFDSGAFSNAWPNSGSSLNAGLGAAGLSQWYVAWRLCSDQKEDIQHLIMGAFDHLLTQPGKEHWSSWHSNDALAFYADPEWTTRFGSRNKIDDSIYRAARLSPLFTERGGLWSKVELFRRKLEGIGMIAETSETTEFGRVNDAKLLLENSMEQFRSRCLAEAKPEIDLAPQIVCILDEAAAKKIKVTVVMMPMPAARFDFYRSSEWVSYLDHLRGLLAKHSCRLIDATEWIESKNLFLRI